MIYLDIFLTVKEFLPTAYGFSSLCVQIILDHEKRVGHRADPDFQQTEARNLASLLKTYHQDLQGKENPKRKRDKERETKKETKKALRELQRQFHNMAQRVLSAELFALRADTAMFMRPFTFHVGAMAHLAHLTQRSPFSPAHGPSA